MIDNKTINQLVLQYQKTEKNSFAELLYKEFGQMIKEKASWLYHAKSFNLFGKLFYIKDLKIIDKEELESDLWVNFFELAKKYNLKEGDFKTYFISSIWNYIPSLLTKDAVKGLSRKSLNNISEENEEYTEETIDDTIMNPLKKQMWIECEKSLTDIERQVFEMLKKRHTQQEIAKKLKVTQPYICLIVRKLRKKIKKYL